MLQDGSFHQTYTDEGGATVDIIGRIIGDVVEADDTIMLAARRTVLLTVVAHGVSANPLVKTIGARQSISR